VHQARTNGIFQLCQMRASNRRRKAKVAPGGADVQLFRRKNEQA
jgi:hypothetical protein